MMHTKTLVVDGDLEHVRVGELRQPLAGAERRAERRRHQPRSRRAAARRTSSRTVKVSHRLELATWRERSLLMKTRESFWASFGEVF